MEKTWKNVGESSKLDVLTHTRFSCVPKPIGQNWAGQRDLWTFVWVSVRGHSYLQVPKHLKALTGTGSIPTSVFEMLQTTKCFHTFDFMVELCEFYRYSSVAGQPAISPLVTREFYDYLWHLAGVSDEAKRRRVEWTKKVDKNLGLSDTCAMKMCGCTVWRQNKLYFVDGLPWFICPSLRPHERSRFSSPWPQRIWKSSVGFTWHCEFRWPVKYFQENDTIYNILNIVDYYI